MRHQTASQSAWAVRSKIAICKVHFCQVFAQIQEILHRWRYLYTFWTWVIMITVMHWKSSISEISDCRVAVVNEISWSSIRRTERFNSKLTSDESLPNTWQDEYTTQSEPPIRTRQKYNKIYNQLFQAPSISQYFSAVYLHNRQSQGNLDPSHSTDRAVDTVATWRLGKRAFWAYNLFLLFVYRSLLCSLFSSLVSCQMRLTPSIISLIFLIIHEHLIACQRVTKLRQSSGEMIRFHSIDYTWRLPKPSFLESEVSYASRKEAYVHGAWPSKVCSNQAKSTPIPSFRYAKSRCHWNQACSKIPCQHRSPNA